MAKKRGFIAVATAVTVGFVTGILTAPRSGKESRKKIKQVASKALVEAEDKLKTLYSSLNQQVQELESLLKTLSGKTKKDLLSLQEMAKQLTKRVKVAISDLHEGIISKDEVNKIVREAQNAERKISRAKKKHSG